MKLVKGSAAAKAWGAKMKSLRKGGTGNSQYRVKGVYNTGMSFGRVRGPPKPKHIPGSGKTGMTRAQWLASPQNRETLAKNRANARRRQPGHPYIMRQCRREAQMVVNAINHHKFKTVGQVKKAVNQMLGRHSTFGHVAPRISSNGAYLYGGGARVKLPPLPSIPQELDFTTYQSSGKHGLESTTMATSTGSYKKKKV